MAHRFSKLGTAQSHIVYLLVAGEPVSEYWGPNMNILVSASHLLITANCSSNFAIYCFKVKIKGVKANINIAKLS